MPSFEIDPAHFPAEMLDHSHPTPRVWVRTDETRVGEIRREFGIRDHKGREIGGLVVIVECNRTPAAPDDGAHRLVHDWHGTRYEARPHATRNGIPYGASRRGRQFATEAEARADADRYFALAIKRADKKFGQ